jgi:RNA polymerase sigma-70 factor (ECF subfamily)
MGPKNVSNDGRTRTMEETDGQLLTRYRRGQVDALERLVERYRRSLFGFIYNMTRGREEADEVFQEVWFRAIKKIDMYREDNFCGWLIRIAHNMVIDRARRKKPDVSLDEEKEDGTGLLGKLAAKEADPGSRAVAGDTAERIARAVATLPVEQKEVFLMRVQADLSFKEIANSQKVSINTALARMQYALSKLRIVLRRDYDELATRGGGL